MPPPPLPTQPDPLQVAFATKFIHTALTSDRAGFIGAMIHSGEGDQVLVRWWNSFASNFVSEEEMLPPTGLSHFAFREGDQFIVFIVFPAARVAGEAYFGAVVLGPCDDPQFSVEAQARMPFRYFVLVRAANGTTVEEWTVEPPIHLGSGPEPEPQLFAEWVINHAARSATDMTVTVRRDNDEIVAAIERARHELPAVLQRLVAGELQDASFTVKIPIKDGDCTEHFWLSETIYADGKFSGIINADPQSVTTVKRGDRRTVSIAEVTDWMYARNQKMHGNYTLRALLSRMPPHEAAQYRALLAEEGP